MPTMYATLSSKGQITLPAEVRRALGLQPGQRLAVRIEDGHLVIDAPKDLDSVRAQSRSRLTGVQSKGKNSTTRDGRLATIDAMTVVVIARSPATVRVCSAGLRSRRSRLSSGASASIVYGSSDSS